MTSKNTKKFFQRDGKPLRATVDTISSVTTSDIYINQALFEEEKPQNKTSQLVNKYKELSKGIKVPKIQVSIPTINISTVTKWLSYSSLVFGVAAVVLLVVPHKMKPNIDAYSIYSSKPFTMDEISYDVYTKDSRSQRINGVFKTYDCPLEGMGETFVHEADENDIPWWFVAAISFQESSCGKNSPKIDGQESYNAWGWAVYGENVHTFDNWARGIETVSRYMNKRFFSQGLTNPCEIMRIYTPQSNGSWCEGIEHFKEEFINYKTPNTSIM